MSSCIYIELVTFNLLSALSNSIHAGSSTSIGNAIETTKLSILTLRQIPLT